MNIEELITTIATAFHGVEPPEKITLHVAEAYDNYDKENDEMHRSKDHMGSWEDIPEAHIRGCRNALNHLDKTGMRYYLPAYMIWALANLDNDQVEVDHVLYTLGYSPDDSKMAAYHKEQFSLFSPQQLNACALFIKFCAEDELDRIDAGYAAQQYEQHWMQYAQ